MPRSATRPRAHEKTSTSVTAAMSMGGRGAPGPGLDFRFGPIPRFLGALMQLSLTLFSEMLPNPVCKDMAAAKTMPAATNKNNYCQGSACNQCETAWDVVGSERFAVTSRAFAREYPQWSNKDPWRSPNFNFYRCLHAKCPSLVESEKPDKHLNLTAVILILRVLKVCVTLENAARKRKAER